MIMKVANTYKNWDYDETKAFERNGKQYVIATTKCDRCVKGVFVCRVENGQPVPHPYAGGVCFACGGSGIQKKEIRLYTDKEFENMERAAQKRKEKKEEEYQARIKAEYEQKKTKWLESEGFNKNNITYIYFPNDSFNVKDELKEAGFKFNQNLLWHIAEVPAEFSTKVVPVSLTDVAELSAFGSGYYKPDARKIVEDLLKMNRPKRENSSEWIGEIGERVKEIPVILIKVIGFQGQYGYSRLVKFETLDGNLVNWWSSSAYPFEDCEKGMKFLLTGTIKDLSKDKYEDNEKVTILTRCRVKEM